MKHQYPDFCLEVVAASTRLGTCPAERNREVAQVARGRTLWAICRERQNVGRIVLPQELLVEPTKFRIAGDEAMKRTPLRDAIAKRFGELLQLWNVEVGRLTPASYKWV